MQKQIDELKQLLEKSLEKIKNKNIILLFSGGLDSAVLAKLMQMLKINFIAVTAGTKNTQDHLFAKKSAKEMKLNHKIFVLKEASAKKHAISAVKILKDTNPVYISIAIPEIAIFEKWTEDGIIMTGLGSDELFGGYQTHQDAFKKGAAAVQKECKRRMHQVKKDVLRDKRIAKHYSKEIYFPFLDKKIVQFGLKLPVKMKISEKERKIILRKLAEQIDVPDYIFKRPKKAMQYGSGSNNLLKKIARKEGFKSTNEFLMHYSDTIYQKNKKVKK